MKATKITKEFLENMPQERFQGKKEKNSLPTLTGKVGEIAVPAEVLFHGKRKVLSWLYAQREEASSKELTTLLARERNDLRIVQIEETIRQIMKV